MTPGAVVAGPVPFVTALRSRPGLAHVDGPGGPRITVRVSLPEQWDTIAFNVPAALAALDLKREALARFGLTGALTDDFVIKLRGFEVYDESVTLADGGALDGSTYLLTHRRRRPVR